VKDLVAEWSFSAYQFLLPRAWIGLALVVVVLLPMAAFRPTRAFAGSGLFAASFLFGATLGCSERALRFPYLGGLG
jgi:hypothetical protein